MEYSSDLSATDREWAMQFQMSFSGVYSSEAIEWDGVCRIGDELCFKVLPKSGYDIDNVVGSMQQVEAASPAINAVCYDEYLARQGVSAEQRFWRFSVEKSGGIIEVRIVKDGQPFIVKI